jgi:hypothetical protein
MFFLTCQVFTFLFYFPPLGLIKKSDPVEYFYSMHQHARVLAVNVVSYILKCKKASLKDAALYFLKIMEDLDGNSG